MTFEEWFDEIEGYATRGERFMDWMSHSGTHSGDAHMGKDWLLAAYNAGFKQGQSTLSGAHGVPTPPYEKPMPSPFPRPFIPDPFSGVPSCSKCGLKLDGVMGYVCNDQYCPTFARIWSGDVRAPEITVTSLGMSPYFGSGSSPRGIK